MQLQIPLVALDIHIIFLSLTYLLTYNLASLSGPKLVTKDMLWHLVEMAITSRSN
jgi:hypothetical protein